METEDPFGRAQSEQHGHRDEDEENLRWAALEKLPTYDRMRQGILRRALHHHLDDDDQQAAGQQPAIELPTIEVRYEQLTVEADVIAAGRALPTLWNAATNFLQGLIGRFGSSNRRRITILKNANGVIKPSRMMLLLGPPSSGKSTLMRALTGKLDKNLKVSGSITYCGYPISEFYPERTSAYVGQYDLHNAEMTVRETLDFSRRCLGIGARYEMLAELARRERDAGIKPDPEIDAFMKATAVQGQDTNIITDVTLKVLGLDICADIIIGDEMIRGISGGQKKRVTTGEMLTGPARALFMDEISTGLDSSSTFQIVNWESFKAVMSREQLLMKRNSFIYIFKVTQLIILALMSMTVFLRTKMPHDDIKPWWIWGYWASPMMYSQNAISINEFLASRWAIEMKEQGFTESRLQLLSDVSGAFRPGILTALVGVSGAGKTTLMDVLAGRKTSGAVEGDITLSGYPKKQETFARISGYCEQTDIHSPNVTVYESIIYSAWLRLSSDVDDGTKKMFVEEVMALVELDVLRNTLVGLPGVNGLSTEQRKRLTIAVELVANPSIIFMDEPTSGLDARAAAIVMRTACVEVMYNILQGILYTVIIYAMIGYDWKADKFFYFLFFITASFNYFTLFGMMLVACTPSALLANILITFALPLWNLFAGFLIVRPAIPIWWRWYYWANPVSWTIYGVVASQFGENGGSLSVPGGSPVVVKQFLNDNLGIRHDFLGYVVLVHFAYIIVFLFVFGYSIKFLNFQKR
nr:unnamed protein product [Digitaria exilis]